MVIIEDLVACDVTGITGPQAGRVGAADPSRAEPE